jgi:hypothetical protein
VILVHWLRLRGSTGKLYTIFRCWNEIQNEPVSLEEENLRQPEKGGQRERKTCKVTEIQGLDKK